MRARPPATALIVGALLASVAATACRSAGGPRGRRDDQTTPTRGGVLHLATFIDVRGLDPPVAFDTETQPFLELIYAGLVDYDDDGNLVGDLAEKWEVSDGARSYRFFLRHGVQMQDGNELTADDVKRSVERALHPDTPCPAIEFFKKIEGVEAYVGRQTDHVSGVVVEGPHLVTFRLVDQDATFLPVLALPFLRPVCRSGGTRYDDEWETHACGAGPFMLDAWQHGRYLRLKRFDGYFRPELPYLDGIEMRMDVPRITQRFQMLNGEQDGLFNEWERPGALFFRTHPEWSKYGFTKRSSEVFGDFMNVEMAPFTDRRIRQAVAAALNRPNLQKYYEGWAVVTGHLIPPGIPGYVEDPPYAHKTDLARARALMSEAGYAYDPVTDTGGYPHVLPYYASEGESAVRYTQILQYDLRQIGLRIEVKETTFAQFLAEVGRPNTAPMGFAGWNLDYPDPSDFFEPILTTRAATDEESQNRAFYKNPTLDSLVDRARVELDQQKRLAMYQEAEKIVCEDAPWSFAYNPLRYELVQPWVRGYRPHPVWLKYFKHTWIDAKGKAAQASLVGPRKAESALGMLMRRERNGPR